jgi:energy-coupling factor transport system ATP-binding protein
VTGPERPLLSVNELTFRYRRGTEPALRNVSLELDGGEVLLVAGPSGCGKSTLIRAINGLVPHAYSGDYSGEVRVAGQRVDEMKLRDIALHVGTMLQDPAKQIVGASVEAELAFGPENLGVARTEILERIRRVAARTRIERLLGRETASLSGGEQQLLAAAGVLMMNPRLFVVDEPLANLDAVTAANLLKVLRDLADEGSAIVIVEHRVEEALELRPDRALYLDTGEVRYLGPIAGFLEAADPTAVKLPFEVSLERALRLDSRSDNAGFAAVVSGGDRRRALPGESAARDSRGAPPAESTLRENGATTPRLEFRSTSAGYNGRAVLHEVSARFGARESVAVLGPNGSGKTTLFKTAMNLVKPLSGEVLVDGAPSGERTVADLARTFGYVFQSPGQMLFAPTVREELLFGPRNLGLAADTFDELLRWALSEVGLAEIAGIEERPPLTLSFGQQKRLGIAVALALRPRTLVLDEPSAGQDYRSARHFMTAIGKVRSVDSVYFVTHDVDLALTHAARILLLRDGRIVADGPPAQVARDRDRWRACNLRESSLMRANARWGDEQRFYDAETLAALAARQQAAGGAEGGSAGKS